MTDTYGIIVDKRALWSHERGAGHDIVFRSQMGLKSSIFHFFPHCNPATRNPQPIVCLLHLTDFIMQTCCQRSHIPWLVLWQRHPRLKISQASGCFVFWFLFYDCFISFFFFPLCLQCIITFSEFCSYLHANAWPPDRADNPRASYLVIYL
ncbi:hypothetical protein ASPFODRAFT_313257 [Aspergillus luchuensis CBS 106.47]|uniref:Uncharacterized protein n=1 Tax=Aspergillus luchuensis (strain CBS 106.47) TaxID=1137211 RepID=A0A1M3T982_ASPLC|nr:hypothetical protein ASPFODRAFT_313257 [Aspergillus luchuensis CBS 106.47]